jgi:uncharacterized RDD family membrane protein YckC
MTDSGWDSQGYGQPSPQPGYQQPGYQQPGAYQQPGYQQPGAYQQPGYQQPGAYQQPGYQAPGALSPYQQGAAPGGLYLDPVTGLTIPQGTEVASPGLRVGAFFLSGILGLVTLGIGYFIWGIISWSGGQTPTQQVLGIRCWKVDEGRVASWGQMFVWGLCRAIIDEIAFGGLVSFVMMLANKDKRTLYDRISGIVLLRDPNKVLAPR